MTTGREFRTGDRVRTKVHVPTSDWAPRNQRDFPIGSEGAVVDVHRVQGCGVVLDDDPDQLPAYFDLVEIEHADG